MFKLRKKGPTRYYVSVSQVEENRYFRVDRHQKKRTKKSEKSGSLETKSYRSATEHFSPKKTLGHLLKMILKAFVGQIFLHCCSKMLKRSKLFYLLTFLYWPTGLEVHKYKTASSKTLQRIVDYYPTAAMLLASISIFFLLGQCFVFLH